MASPAQIANDLEAHAKHLERTHFKNVAQSCARGAATIRELLDLLAEMDAAAEGEATRFEAYRNGAER